MVGEKHQNVTGEVADRSLSQNGVDSVLRISLSLVTREIFIRTADTRTWKQKCSC